MRLDIFEENNSQKWNDIINSSVNGTLYHTWEWLRIVEKHSGSKLFPLVFFDENDEKPFAAIPLFYMKKFGVKMIFSPPPGSAITLGPVFVDKGYKQHKFELAYLDFQANVDDFIKKIGSSYTLIITSPGLLDMRPFVWAGYDVSPHYTYKIDLSQGEGAVWENMSKNLRKNIRRAQKNGLHVVEGADVDSINYVTISLKNRYASQNIKFQVREFYLKDLYKQFGHSAMRVLFAMNGDKIVGSRISITYKDTVIAFMGGVRNQLNDLESNELLHWENITKGIHDGLKWYDMTGADTRHLCEFKAGFCPGLSIYFSIKKTGLLGSLAEKAYMLKKKGGFSLKQ